MGNDIYRGRVLAAASFLGYEIVSNTKNLVLRRSGRVFDDVITLDGTRMISHDCEGVRLLEDELAIRFR